MKAEVENRMEIVFGKSAYGTLKYMGFDPTDLYCFELGLSMGDLNKKEYPDLTELKARLEHGEGLRIWYSEKSPEEACGFCWLMAELKEPEEAALYAVPLPAHFLLADGCVMTCSDWGGVGPEDWAPFLEEKPLLLPARRVGASLRWQELAKENAPLRAIVNGNLVSVPGDFYDHFLLRELEKQEGDFPEARLIGRVMGIYGLGIGDVLLHQRMEAFLEKGLLTVISPAEEGKPAARRILRKTQQ